MVLDMPGALLGKDEGLFKKSPIDGEVDKYEGGKKVPSADDDTKEFWSSITHGTPNRKGDYIGVETAGGTTDATIAFKVPHDFNTIVSAEIIGIFDGTDASIDMIIASDYAAVGETYNVHSEIDNTTTYSSIDDKMAAIDVSGILSNLSANDIVGLYVNNQDASPVFFVIGFRLRYT